MHAGIESRSANGRDSEGGKENETCTFGETGTFLWNLIGMFGDLYIWGTGMFGTLKCLAEMYRYVFKKSPSVYVPLLPRLSALKAAWLVWTQQKQEMCSLNLNFSLQAWS